MFHCGIPGWIFLKLKPIRCKMMRHGRIHWQSMAVFLWEGNFRGVVTAFSAAVKRRVVAGQPEDPDPDPMRYVCTSSIDTLGTTD